MDEDAALFGLVLPEVEDQEEADFEVLKDNWPVLEVFFALDDCAWQHTGMGDLVGLDYQAAHIIWGYAGIKPNKDTFMGLMLFTRAIVNERNKRKDK
jgi:hypothetical protein